MASYDCTRCTWRSYERLEPRHCLSAVGFAIHEIVDSVEYDPASVAAADLDGDGDADLLVAGGNSTAWHENIDGDGTFGPARLISTRFGHPSYAADVDGDSDLDVVSEHRSSSSWYENTDGQGTFGPQRVSELRFADGTPPGAGGGFSRYAADVDGDEYADLILNSFGGIHWMEVKQDQQTVEERQQFLPYFGLAHPLGVHVADLDGDRDMDVLGSWFVEELGTVGYETTAWWENTDGLGTFSLRIIAEQANRVLFATDVDGDDDQDLVAAAYEDDRLRWYENTDGRGSFDPSRLITRAGRGISLHAADIDGDGDRDLLAATRDTDSIAWYENRIPGDANDDGWFDSADLVLIFQAGEYEDKTPENSTYAEGDWNGDGDFTSADLVCAFQQGGFVPAAIDLVIQGLREDAQPVPNENNPGALIALNHDDDNANHILDRHETNVAGEDDLAPLTFVARALDPGRGHLTLETVSGADHVDLWMDANKSRKIGSGNSLSDLAGFGTDGKSATWDLAHVTLGVMVWVEGIQTSGTAADVEFKLTLTVGDEEFTDRNVKVTVVNVDLDVDTDRDGIVELVDDESGEDDWQVGRGAIYSVNLDRDGNRRSDAGIPLPDAISYNDAGQPTDEDFRIENRADQQDLTPMVIRKPADAVPPGYSVFLTAAEAEDLRRVHIFNKIAADPTNLAIWGRATGGPPPLELEITDWVNPTSVNFRGDTVTGDATFGIEGLMFRYVGMHHLSELAFDGEVDLTLQLRRQSTVVASDSVRLKVAPWMMLSRDQTSEEIWALDLGQRNDEFLFTESADTGYVGLDDSAQLRVIQGRIGEHWLQDQVEIGYTQRPGGPKTHVVLQLPYGGASSDWPLVHLLGRDIGIFQLGTNLGGAGGDHGGNLEILTPNDTHPLGRIATGENTSPVLRDFFTSQQVQDPFFDLPTSWLTVGHIDEFTSFLAHGTVAIADPALAWNLIADTDVIPVEDRFRTVFFATGAQPEAGLVTGSSSDRLYDGPAIGWLTTVDENRLVDGETLTIRQDDVVQRVFEVEKVGGVADGNIALDMTAAGLSTADDVRDLIVATVNDAAFGVHAVADGPATVHLWNEYPGDLGNQPISETIVDPGFMTHGMAGGKATSRNFADGPPWNYVRTAGQVAHIAQRHDGWLEIDLVWNTSSKIVPGSGASAHIYGYTTSEFHGGLGQAPNNGIWDPGVWWSRPAAGDSYVVVEDTQFWHTGTPAIVTVEEVLSDSDFERLNRWLLPNLMADVNAALHGRAPPGALDVIPVPSLFFGRIDAIGQIDGRSAFAFNPGPTNLQPVNGKLYVPRQFGPKDSSGQDIFERSIRASLGTSVEWVDSWELYHGLFGEVHCGTVVKREALSVDWWT